MGTALTDRFGRTATDLRLSLTDRCDLRCTYCMPPEGLEWLPAPELLTDDEIVRLATVAVGRLGITTIRLTGGEPLLRRSIVDLVARLAALEPGRRRRRRRAHLPRTRCVRRLGIEVGVVALQLRLHLRFALGLGFQFCGVIREYLPEDRESGGNAALLVWLNPLYSPAEPPANVERPRKCA